MDGWTFVLIVPYNHFSLLAKNVYATLFNSNPPERNDFFLPGRMVWTSILYI